MQIPYRDNLGRCSEHLCLHAIGRAPIRSQELCRTQLIVSNSERFRHYVIVGTHTQPIRIFTTDRVLFQHKESFGTKRRNVHNPTMVYRTLRPAPPGDGEPPPRPMEVHPKGRNRVTLACVSCKEKRRKVRTTNTFSRLRADLSPPAVYGRPSTVQRMQPEMYTMHLRSTARRDTYGLSER